MSSSSPSGISSKTIGLIAAIILLLVFGTIIWVSISKAPKPTKSNQGDFFPEDISQEIPNIEDTQTGGAMLVTMVDKNDPTRVAATLQADRFEPIGEGRRRLDNPESWIFLKDGRVIQITADFATMLMPDPNQPPESGTLEGHILIQSFESIDTDEPTLTASFDEPLEFERRYLRLRSAGHFQISSSAFDFAGSDLTLILNELRDRVELIDVVQGDQIVLHLNNQTSKKSSEQSNPKPDAQPIESTAADPMTTTSTQAANSPVQSTPESTPAQVLSTLLSMYHIVLDDQVVASVSSDGSSSGSVNADHLELWVALTEGNLPENAIKDIAFVQTKRVADSTPTTDSTPSSTPAPASPALANAGTQTNESVQAGNLEAIDDLVITWSGKMSLRPIDGDKPAQLVDNALALRLTANEDAGIIFDIPAQQLTGQAFAATYLASKGVLELESAQTQAGIIKFDSLQTGTLNATTLAADLSTGIIKLDGRGSIKTIAQDPTNPDSEASIQWKNRAEFNIAMDQQSNAMTDRLKRAYFDGNVIARQDGNTIGARTLDAAFNAERPSAIALEHITMTEGVLSSANRSIISGSELIVELAPSSVTNSITPLSLTAIGKVLARTPEQLLKTDHLIVEMMEDGAGKIAVQYANAQGSVRYTDSQRSTARADALEADGVNETMVLLGSPAQVGQGGSTIVGENIALNARTRGIEVLGPGSFDHDIALQADDANSNKTGHIHTTWKGSMRFDDAIGTVVCEEDVKMVSTPDAYTRDTIEAHRAIIKLSPMPTRDPIAGKPRDTSKRTLLSARLSGHAPAGQDPIPATIESRSYDQNDLERVTGLIYLEGSDIIADNRAQTLEVPAPGTLLILDRTQADSTSASDANGKTGDGLTRFTWQGKMRLDRAAGNASFANQVLVRQKTISTGKVASITTDQLDARFEIGQQDQEQATRLLGIDAIGSVRFLYEGKELLADSAIYDAITDSLFASAIDKKLVTLYDDSQPAPLSAKTMSWKLEQDRIEINAPSPTRGIGG